MIKVEYKPETVTMRLMEEQLKQEQSGLPTRLRKLAREEIQIGHEIMNKYTDDLLFEGAILIKHGEEIKRLANELEKEG